MLLSSPALGVRLPTALQVLQAVVMCTCSAAGAASRSCVCVLGVGARLLPLNMFRAFFVFWAPHGTSVPIFLILFSGNRQIPGLATKSAPFQSHSIFP